MQQRHEAQGKPKAAVFGGVCRLTVASALFALLVACQPVVRPVDADSPRASPASGKPLAQGYTCCNLRYDVDRITPANLAQLPFIAAGAPIRIGRIEGSVAHAEIDGKPMQLSLEPGQPASALNPWLATLIVAEDPKRLIARWPAAIRQAIERGQLARGMSREQAVIAVGPPQHEDRRRPDNPVWRCGWSGFTPYYVHWAKGSLSRIEGPGDAVASLSFKGK